MTVDEGPSPEDIERFSEETGFCPDCGAEIWDQAEVCPECHAYISGGAGHRSPGEEWFRRKWIGLVIIAVLIAFAMLVL